jgi:hypothetical protein
MMPYFKLEYKDSEAGWIFSAVGRFKNITQALETVRVKYGEKNATNYRVNPCSQEEHDAWVTREIDFPEWRE